VSIGTRCFRRDTRRSTGRVVGSLAIGRGNSGAHESLRTFGFGTCVADAVVLAVEADDEHRPPMAVALRLPGGQDGSEVALRRYISDAFTEAAVAELLGTTEKVDGTVGAVGRKQRLHSPEMLIAQGQDVRPHSECECSIAADWTEITTKRTRRASYLRLGTISRCGGERQRCPTSTRDKKGLGR